MSETKSLYAKYVEERTNKEVLETEIGFATYLFENDYVYIEDIYVLPEHRNYDNASKMADKIGEIAKERGINKMIGSVAPTANNSTDSIKVLLSYGFELLSSSKELIYFVKNL